MTDTQRPERPTARAVRVRPGWEPDEVGALDEDLPPARKSRAPKQAAARKAAPRKATPKKAVTKVTPKRAQPRKAASKRPAARARRTAVEPAAGTAPARARRSARSRPQDAPDIDFAYTDDAHRVARSRASSDVQPIVRADGTVHLALDDEPWWRFPQVCVKTGETTNATITHVASGAPKWSYAAFLLGVLPGYLIVRTLFPNATLKLPFAQRIRNRRRVASAAALLLFLGGIGAMIGGAAAESESVAGFGFLAFFLGLVAILIAARMGRVKVRIENREVVIPKVHPAFAASFAMQPTPDEQRAMFENTSGAGKAAFVPPAIKRWNWGAFFLTPIWAIGNGVWIGLLGLVPVVNLVMSVVLGIRGNEWAWRKKRWPSVENFLQSQRTWAGASAAILAATVVLGLIYSFVGYEPAPTAPGYGTTSTTIADYANGDGGVKAGTAYGFVATFPSTPRHQKITQHAGDIELPIDVLTSESSDSGFAVAVVEYPDVVNVADPRGLLRAAANGSAGAITDGKVVRYAETSVRGDPAAGVLVSGANGVFARQRYVLHGHKLFTIQVVSLSENPPGFGRFVDSFRVLTAIDIDRPAQ